MRALVIGDSHTAIFKSRWFELFRNIFLNKITFEVTTVQGATISGIENPNSQTKAGSIFKKALSNHTQLKYCIVQIGEVDTGFVLWYKHEKEGIEMNLLFQKSVNRYIKLIEQVRNAGYTPIIISTPLPTIKDNCTWGEVANLRKTIKASQIKRTKLTLDFNSSIREFCEKNSILNINLDNISVGRKGVVKTFLRHYRKNDHHYNPITYSLLLVFSLKRVIK